MNFSRYLVILSDLSSQTTIFQQCRPPKVKDFPLLNPLNQQLNIVKTVTAKSVGKNPLPGNKKNDYDKEEYKEQCLANEKQELNSEYQEVSKFKKLNSIYKLYDSLGTVRECPD